MVAWPELSPSEAGSPLLMRGPNHLSHPSPPSSHKEGIGSELEQRISKWDTCFQVEIQPISPQHQLPLHSLRKGVEVQGFYLAIIAPFIKILLLISFTAKMIQSQAQRMISYSSRFLQRALRASITFIQF